MTTPKSHAYDSHGVSATELREQAEKSIDIITMMGKVVDAATLWRDECYIKSYGCEECDNLVAEIKKLETFMGLEL